MTSGTIKTIFSDRKKQNAIFPRTKISAISDENNRGLGAILENKASKDYVAAEIAKAQLGGGGSVDLSGYVAKDDVIDIAHGGTGATDAASARANLNLRMQTFYSISQIGLSGTPTTNEVFAAMPALSCLVGDAIRGNNNNISDLPTQRCNVILFKGQYSYGQGIATKVNESTKETYVFDYINNGTNNGWTKVANAADLNVKTYSSIDQLGLSGGVTTDAVFAAMPTWSMVVINNSKTSGNYLTDRPTDYCNVVLFKSNANYGSGIASKVNSARQEHYMYSWYIGSSNNVWSAPGEMNLLWTNASPTSSFASFTPISLDLTDYKQILVWYRLYTGDSTAQHISSLVPIGVGSGTKHEDTVNATTCFAAIDDKWVHRYCFASASAITFGSGGQRTSISANYTVDNKYMIPERIYGVR